MKRQIWNGVLVAMVVSALGWVWYEHMRANREVSRIRAEKNATIKSVALSHADAMNATGKFLLRDQELVNRLSANGCSVATQWRFNVREKNNLDMIEGMQ